MVASWPIPFQGLLLPRLLSNVHAPLLGEASIVFQLSQRPIGSEERRLVLPRGGRLPWSVCGGVGIYGLIGLFLSIWGLRWTLVRRRSRR